MACLPEIPSDFADRELEKTGLLPAPTSDAEPLVRADTGGPQVNYFLLSTLPEMYTDLPFIDFLFGERLNFLLCGRMWVGCYWAFWRFVMGSGGHPYRFVIGSFIGKLWSLGADWMSD